MPIPRRHKVRTKNSCIIPEHIWSSIVAEFEKKGYSNCSEIYLAYSRRKKGSSKVIEFKEKGLPSLYILRSKDWGPPSYRLAIHPNTPRDLIESDLVVNRRNVDDPFLFLNADTRSFPSIFPRRAKCHLRILFNSAEELGQILKNLISIEEAYHVNDCSEQKHKKYKYSADYRCVNRFNFEFSLNSDLLHEIHTPIEGKKHSSFTYRYERDKKLREAALKEFGYTCRVCGLNFETIYGDIGKNFIEVHHTVPISFGERESNYKNLQPLCSNCHRMIHRLYKKLKPKEYGNAIEILRNILVKD